MNVNDKRKLQRDLEKEAYEKSRLGKILAFQNKGNMGIVGNHAPEEGYFKMLEQEDQDRSINSIPSLSDEDRHKEAFNRLRSMLR